MLLCFEIAITVMGLIKLITGKGLGKGAPRHWQFRLLGAFSITLIPFVFLVHILFNIVWILTHPDLSANHIDENLRWPLLGVEFGIALLYAFVGSAWDTSIRRKAALATTDPLDGV